MICCLVLTSRWNCMFQTYGFISLWFFHWHISSLITSGFSDSSWHSLAYIKWHCPSFGSLLQLEEHKLLQIRWVPSHCFWFLCLEDSSSPKVIHLFPIQLSVYFNVDLFDLKKWLLFNFLACRWHWAMDDMGLLYFSYDVRTKCHSDEWISW